MQKIILAIIGAAVVLFPNIIFANPKINPPVAVIGEEITISYDSPGRNGCYRQTGVKTEIQDYEIAHSYQSSYSGEYCTQALVAGGFTSKIVLNKAGKYKGIIKHNGAIVAEYLLTVCKDKSETAQVLKELNDQKIKKALQDFEESRKIEDRDVRNNMRATAIYLLAEAGTPAGKYLIIYLNDTDPRIREQVCWALGSIKDNTAIEHLINLLRDNEDSVRAQAAWALENITGKAFGEDYKNWIQWRQSSKSARQDAVTIKIIYENRQCIGNNGLNPERVKLSLREKDIKILKIRMPKEIEVPVCEACYPACSVRYEYQIDVKEDKQELANTIINGLKIELASRPQ